MVEATESEADALDALDQVVGGFGGAVGGLRSVPGEDLAPPGPQGPAECPDLGRVVWFGLSAMSSSMNTAASSGLSMV